MIPRRHILRDGELERLFRRISPSVAMRTVPLVTPGHLPGGPVVDAESDLARAAVVVARAGQAEVGRRSGGPGRHGAALGGADLVEVAPAWEGRLLAAAVVGVGQLLVGRADAVRVLFGLEGVGVVEPHVCLHGGGKEGEDGDGGGVDGSHLCLCLLGFTFFSKLNSLF